MSDTQLDDFENNERIERAQARALLRVSQVIGLPSSSMRKGR